MKWVLEVLGWLAALALLAFASHAVFAAPLGPGGGLSQQQPLRAPAPGRVARERPGGQEQGGAQDPAGRRERERRARGREEISAASLVREARTVYVAPTEHLDKTYLEYKLHKYRELDDWDLMLVADPRAADLVITVDKTALNYIFNITDVRTAVIVASGKCVAVNGRLAAEFLGREIIHKIRDARAADRGPRKKKHREEDADEDESES